MEANTMNIISWLLIAVLALNANGLALQTSAPSASVQTQTNGAQRAAKAKADVQKRGAGEQSRVRVSLRDGTEVKGYISRIDENSFAVTDKKSGKVTTISYEDVNEVKRQGLSKTAKILIVSLIVVGAVIGIGFAVACSAEGGPHC
jgi:small nuclear ribonucleoprotein (snRNP)-like protein